MQSETGAVPTDDGIRLHNRQRLDAAVVTALANPDVRARFVQDGYEVFPRDQQTPEKLHAYQETEIQKWWPIIKAANIVPTN